MKKNYMKEGCGGFYWVLHLVQIQFLLVVLTPLFANGETNLETLEFRGLMTVGKTTHVYLSDTGLGHVGWLEVGTSREGISIVELRANPISVHLIADGSSKIVPLSKSKIKPLHIVPKRPFARNTAADISFDASLLIVYEIAVERRSEVRRKKRQVVASRW